MTLNTCQVQREVSVFVESNDGNRRRSGTEYCKSGSKRDWILLPGNVKVRDDDQMELTTDVTGPGSKKT